MKKYFCVSLLTSFAFVLFGQSSEELKLPERKRLIDRVEVFAGPGFSLNYGNKFIENYQDSNIRNKRLSKFGYQFGFGIFHPITNKFSLNIKASFQQKGTKSTFTNESLFIESEYEYQYYTLSIGPQISIGKNVFFSLGGYYSLLKKVNGLEVVHSHPDIFTERFAGRMIRHLGTDGHVYAGTFIPGLRSFHRNDFGVSIRVGYLVHIKNNHNLSLEISDFFGWRNINILTDGNIPERNHSLNFTIGYILEKG